MVYFWFGLVFTIERDVIRDRDGNEGRRHHCGKEGFETATQKVNHPFQAHACSEAEYKGEVSSA